MPAATISSRSFLRISSALLSSAPGAADLGRLRSEVLMSVATNPGPRQETQPQFRVGHAAKVPVEDTR